jgi:hypothetical protein
LDEGREVMAAKPLPPELVIPAPSDAHKWTKADKWGCEDYVSEAAIFLALHLYEHFHGQRMPYGSGALWDRVWRACGGVSGLGGYFSQVGEDGWPPVSRNQQGGLLYREPGVGVGLSRVGKRYFSEWPVDRLMYGIARLHNTGLWDEIVPHGAEWRVQHTASRAQGAG